MAEEEQSFNAENLMKLILRTALLNAVQRHSIKQHRTKIAVFERAMESIKTSTGISGGFGGLGHDVSAFGCGCGVLE